MKLDDLTKKLVELEERIETLEKNKVNKNVRGKYVEGVGSVMSSKELEN